ESSPALAPVNAREEIEIELHVLDRSLIQLEWMGFHGAGVKHLSGVRAREPEDGARQGHESMRGGSRISPIGIHPLNLSPRARCVMATQVAWESAGDSRLELERLRARVAELEAWNRAAERAAEALVRSEDALRKIFDHSNDGILVVDPAGDRIVD